MHFENVNTIKTYNVFSQDYKVPSCLFWDTCVCLLLLIAGNDKSEAGLLGSVSKILGTSRVQFKNPCGGEKNTGSLWSEQGEQAVAGFGQTDFVFHSSLGSQVTGRACFMALIST